MGKVQKPFPVNVCTLLRRCAEKSAESGSAEREGEVEPHRSAEARVGAVARLGGRARCPFVLLVLPRHVAADADHIRDAVVGAESEAAKVTAVATLDEGAAVHPVQGIEASQEADEAFGLEAERVVRLDRDARSDAPDTERTESARVAVADRAPHEPVDVRVDRSEEPRTGLEHVRRVATLAPSQAWADREPHVDLVTGLLADEVELGELFAGAGASETSLQLGLPATDAVVVTEPFASDAVREALLEIVETPLRVGLPAGLTVRTVEVEVEVGELHVGLGVVGQHAVARLGILQILALQHLLVGLELATLGRGQLALPEELDIALEARHLLRVDRAGAALVTRLARHRRREHPSGALAAEALALLRRRSVADERDGLGGRSLLFVVLVTIVVGRLALEICRRHRVDVPLARLVRRDAGRHLVGLRLAVGLGVRRAGRVGGLQAGAGIRVGLGRVGRERDEDERRNDNESGLDELVHGNLPFRENVVGVTRDPLRRAATCVGLSHRYL